MEMQIKDFQREKPKLLDLIPFSNDNDVTCSATIEELKALITDDICNIVDTNKGNWDDKFTKEETLGKINELINNLIDGSLGTLDTLNEIATALGNDPNFATTIINLLANKVEKLDGESLVKTAEWENIKNEVETVKNTFSSIAVENTLYTTTNIGNKYAITVPNLTALTDGYTVSVKFNVSSTGQITVNPTEVGDIRVLDYYGNPVTNVRENLIVNLKYESTSNSFILLGKGGGGGNAMPEQLIKGSTATVDTGTIVGTLDLTNLISANIKAEVTINGVQGKTSVVDTTDALATAAQLLNGASAYVGGVKISGTMPKKAASTITPGTANQTIAAGQYINEVQTILGDTNLISDNVKATKSIFGVAGKASVVDTADATAITADIASGKTAYVNGSLVTGNGGVRKYCEYIINHTYGNLESIILPFLPSVATVTASNGAQYVWTSKSSGFIYPSNSPACTLICSINRTTFTFSVTSSAATGVYSLSTWE